MCRRGWGDRRGLLICGRRLHRCGILWRCNGCVLLLRLNRRLYRGRSGLRLGYCRAYPCGEVHKPLCKLGIVDGQG